MRMLRQLSTRPKMVPAARLLKTTARVIPGQYLVTDLWFEVPLDYNNLSAGYLTLFGRAIAPSTRAVVPSGPPDFGARPWMAFLEGGPGYGNQPPQDHPITPFILAKGYQMLYLDYRGIGGSTPVTADTLVLQGGPQQQADYLKLFRAPENVMDLEAVRQCITADLPADKKQWSIIGQSFGGFVGLSYLSFHPGGLRECFISGGMASVGKTADEVYTATYRKTIQRNAAYFAKFPEDVESLRHLARHIADKGGYTLPAGGKLTVRRLMAIGLPFGAHGGFDQVHAIIQRLHADLDMFGFLTRPALSAIEGVIAFDNNVIYAVLHEPIYCCTKGVASKWSADRIGRELDEFAWIAAEDDAAAAALFTPDREKPLYLAGEMIYPFYFDTYPELTRLKEVADILARFDGWGDLYDEEQLARNEVPVYASSFIDDMYVEYGLVRETIAKVKNVHSFETNTMYHNAIRMKPDEVLKELFKMKEDTID